MLTYRRVTIRVNNRRERQQDHPAQDRSVVRSIDRFLPVFQYGAPILRALKISHCVRADAPLRKHAAFSHTLVILTRQAGWNVKSTNPHLDF